MSELVWIGFVLVFVSEFARYVAFTGELASSNLFIVEIIALVVALVFAATLKVLFSPFLDVLPFADNEKQEGEGQCSSPLIPVRNGTLVVGSMTMAAWYFAFAVNYIPATSISLLLVLFVALLSVVALINLLWQHRL